MDGRTTYPGNKDEIQTLKHQLRHCREFDSLTGIYNKATFLKKAALIINAHTDIDFDIACIDIERFKLINDIYGTDAGDELLRHLAQQLKEHFPEPLGLAARMFNDVFVLLLPQDQRQEAEQSILEIFQQYPLDMVITPAIGFCPIPEHTENISTICDRAMMALKSIKGNYFTHSAVYDINQFLLLLEEQELLNDVEAALINHEFELYLQPKCNMHTGKIIGAEALVRWNHPVKGMIPPNMFIPVFERNGFIKRLDAYIWEEAARWLRRWIDAGYDPLPISVNLSRIDIFGMDVCAILNDILERYQLDVRLLELEITESAYVSQPEDVIHALEQLMRNKFTILMDDFGSGYSSLNMLNSINVDILKLDMRFLERDDQKSKNILESVLHMSKWLNLPVIAEGVEFQWQVDFLTRLGCIYAQGFFYYRPMPVADYEALLCDESKIDHHDNGTLRLEQEMLLDFHDLFNQNMMTDRLLENVLGAIALCSFNGSRLLLLRASREYYRITGLLGQLAEKNEQEWDLISTLRPQDRTVLLDALRQAKEDTTENGSEVYVRQQRSDNPRWFRIRLFYLAEKPDGDIFYGAFTDISKQMDNMEQLRIREEQFHLAMQATNSLLFELDIATRTAHYSEHVQALFNLDSNTARAPEDFIEQGVICPESHADLLDAYDAIYSGSNQVTCIICTRLADESKVWNRITLTTIKNELGQAIKAVGIVDTISHNTEPTAEIKAALEQQAKNRQHA